VNPLDGESPTAGNSDKRPREPRCAGAASAGESAAGSGRPRALGDRSEAEWIPCAPGGCATGGPAGVERCYRPATGEPGRPNGQGRRRGATRRGESGARAAGTVRASPRDGRGPGTGRARRWEEPARTLGGKRVPGPSYSDDTGAGRRWARHTGRNWRPSPRQMTAPEQQPERGAGQAEHRPFRVTPGGERGAERRPRCPSLCTQKNGRVPSNGRISAFYGVERGGLPLRGALRGDSLAAFGGEPDQTDLSRRESEQLTKRPDRPGQEVSRGSPCACGGRHFHLSSPIPTEGQSLRARSPRLHAGL